MVCNSASMMSGQFLLYYISSRFCTATSHHNIRTNAVTFDLPKRPLSDVNQCQVTH